MSTRSTPFSLAVSHLPGELVKEVPAPVVRAIRLQEYRPLRPLQNIAEEEEEEDEI